VNHDELRIAASNSVAENMAWLSQVDRSGLSYSHVITVEVLAVVAAITDALQDKRISGYDARVHGDGWIRTSEPELIVLYEILDETLKLAGIEASQTNYSLALAEVRHWWRMAYGTDYKGLCDEDASSHTRSARDRLVDELKNQYVAKVIISASDDWVASIDRSALGSFRVPANILAAADSVMLTGTHPVNATVNAILQEFFMHRFASENLEYNSGYEAITEAELWFWQNRTKGYAYRQRSDLKNEVKKNLDQLEFITSYPTMLGFFEAGIWDIGFIENCIAEGIEPSLATSVQGGV